MVRKFLAAFAAPELEELVSFFSDDAVFIDGPRGVHRGVDAIRSELEAELAMGYGTAKIDVHSLVASGGTVMMEGRENYRYSYDLKSVTDQVEAAGFKVPT